MRACLEYVRADDSLRAIRRSVRLVAELLSAVVRFLPMRGDTRK
jgi:hypothetical protein